MFVGALAAGVAGLVVFGALVGLGGLLSSRVGNPIPIIVPCHRVVGSKGELTGFGGGIERKRWLLEHEGALMPLGR